jgi:hypothetical protein
VEIRPGVCWDCNYWRQSTRSNASPLEPSASTAPGLMLSMPRLPIEPEFCSVIMSALVEFVEALAPAELLPPDFPHALVLGPEIVG